MKKFIAVTGAAFMPFFALAAQSLGDILSGILDDIDSLLSTLIPVLMLLAVAIFLWGIVKFITAAGDEAKAKEAKGYIIYGLIGLFVIVAFWGIISVLQTTFGTTDTSGSFPNFNP